MSVNKEYRVIVNLYDGKGEIPYNFEVITSIVKAIQMSVKAQKLVDDFGTGKVWIEEREVTSWRSIDPDERMGQYGL